MDEKVIGLLSAAVGAPAPEVAELIKSDEGIADLLAKHSTKLESLKRDADGRALRIVTKAIKDAGVEGEVFQEGRPFKDNVTAALDALKTHAAEAASGADAAPLVTELREKLNQATAATDRKVAEARADERRQFESQQREFEGRQLAARKAQLAEAQVTELSPVFGDAAKAAGRRAALVAHLSTLPTVEVDGQLFEADAAGEIKRDASGNAVKYADLVRRETESRYDLPVSTHRESTGLNPSELANHSGYQFKEFKGQAPKTEAEVLALRNDQSLSLAARKEVGAYWEAQGQ